MNELKTTDSNLVCVAIGEESGYWYVQTADIKPNTYLSEIVAENLSKEDAINLASELSNKYGFKIVVWSNESVYVDGYGYGIVRGNDLDEEYPIFIEFEGEDMHESESSGLFKFEQIELI